MLERLYVLSPDLGGWRVILNRESLGLFPTQSEAFTAAAAAARRSRAAGHYAWVKVRHGEIAVVD